MSKIYLTQKSFDEITIELKRLTQESYIIAKEKAEAWSRDGDGPHDNPMYHKFNDDLTQVNNKINELQSIINLASIVTLNQRDIEKVSIGSIVEFKQCISAKKQIRKYEIVDYGNTSVKEGKISYDSPLGKSLLEKKKSDKFSILLPIGKVEIEILELHKSF